MLTLTQVIISLELQEGAGTAILTFLGGFHPQTQALMVNRYSTPSLSYWCNVYICRSYVPYKLGNWTQLKEILDAHRPPGGRLRSWT